MAKIADHHSFGITVALLLLPGPASPLPSAEIPQTTENRNRMQAIRRPSVGGTWEVEDWPTAVSGVAAACTRFACVASAVGLPASPHMPCEEYLKPACFHALCMYDVT